MPKQCARSDIVAAWQVERGKGVGQRRWAKEGPPPSIARLVAAFRLCLWSRLTISASTKPQSLAWKHLPQRIKQHHRCQRWNPDGPARFGFDTRNALTPPTTLAQLPPTELNLQALRRYPSRQGECLRFLFSYFDRMHL